MSLNANPIYDDEAPAITEGLKFVPGAKYMRNKATGVIYPWQNEAAKNVNMVPYYPEVKTTPVVVPPPVEETQKIDYPQLGTEDITVSEPTEKAPVVVPNLGPISKKDIAIWAKENLGLDLDPEGPKKIMVAAIREATSE